MTVKNDGAAGELAANLLSHHGKQELNLVVLHDLYLASKRQSILQHEEVEPTSKHPFGLFSHDL
jgi:hypothetical protein